MLHSLTIATAFEFPAGSTIVDLGTGGGFPGIPLAIFFPEVQFLLVDSIGKKIKVVNAVAEGLGLKNVTTRHSRIEEIKDRKFDMVVSKSCCTIERSVDMVEAIAEKGFAKQHSQQAGLDLFQRRRPACRDRRKRLPATCYGDLRDIQGGIFQEKFMLYVPS